MTCGPLPWGRFWLDADGVGACRPGHYYPSRVRFLCCYTPFFVACCCVGVGPHPRSWTPGGRLCVASTRPRRARAGPSAVEAAARLPPTAALQSQAAFQTGAVEQTVPSYRRASRSRSAGDGVCLGCKEEQHMHSRCAYNVFVHPHPHPSRCHPPRDFPTRHSPPCHSPSRQSASRIPPTPHPCPHDPPTHNPLPPLSTVRSTNPHLWRGVVSPGTSAPGWSGPPGP